MKHIGLFEGIGGFSLAARWVGWETVAWCEWNKFGQKVLRYHFPDAEGFGDITKTDFIKYANSIDIITGGFPCQPYSTAGKRLGKNDVRHLWPEMLRAIREVRPSYVVGENVRGLTNWNGGMVFDEVQSDLETEGYEVLPFLLPASSKNAPHLRERIWFVAFNPNSTTDKSSVNLERQNNGATTTAESEKIFQPTHDFTFGFDSVSPKERITTNPERIRQQRQGRTEGQECTAQNKDWEASWTNPNGGWPTQSPVCNGNDGISSRLDITTISRKEWGEETLKSAGNAIVPQVAFEIFKIIKKMNQTK